MLVKCYSSSDDNKFAIYFITLYEVMFDHEACDK